MANDFAKAVIQKLPVTSRARLADAERCLTKHRRNTGNWDFHGASEVAISISPTSPRCVFSAEGTIGYSFIEVIEASATVRKFVELFAEKRSRGSTG
jgi:hypothetical protein